MNAQNESDGQLIEKFGCVSETPFGYSGLIDQDKIARHDFYYFKQGYNMATGEKDALIKSLQSKIEIYERVLELCAPLDDDIKSLDDMDRSALIFTLEQIFRRTRQALEEGGKIL